MPNPHLQILMTGASGMLAQALLKSLGRRQLAATAFSRAQLDIADASAVAKAFEAVHPTLVLNCAAYTKVDQAEQEEDLASRINGIGPENLAAQCRKIGAKLVHFSTDYVFDGTLSRPLKVDDPVGPQSAYGRSKLLGEQALQRVEGLDYLTIRTAWLYGPGGPSFPQTMVNVARAGKPLKVINDQFGAPTFTHDLAEATLDLVDRDARGMYHVTNSGQTNWFEFAKAIFEEFGLAPDLQSTRSAEWKLHRPQSATRPSYSVLDLSKFDETTGRRMRGWRDALREFRGMTT